MRLGLPFNPVTAVLDVRVPTTSKGVSPQLREEILSNIEPGDIVLETNNAYPNWQRMERLAFRSSFTHAAIFEGFKDGKPMLLEATTGDPSGAGVIRTNMEEYFHGPIKLAVIRPNYETPEDRDAALDHCRQQLGKPYDTGFRYDSDQSYYCSELVAKALENMPHPIAVGHSKAVRVGRDSVAPDAFLKLPGAITFGDKPQFWANMASHWPVAAGTALGGLAGIALASHFGPLSATAGGVVGTAAGLLGSICVGNKIQTGHFNLYGVEHK